MMAAPAARDMDITILPPLPPGAFVAFVEDPETHGRIAADVPPVLAGRAPLHVVAGGFMAAMHMSDWPADLGGLILDITESPSPVADMAALVGVLPEDCIVIAIGDANDVHLFRDLVGAGASDYLVRPLPDGALGKALETAIAAKAREVELRHARAAIQAAAAGKEAGSPDIAPLVVACIGTRGGVGTTTIALALASMLGQARRRESLILDLDVHYGSVMLALDLDPTDALREALSSPQRVDNLFVDQSVQRKTELLCALGAEDPPRDATSLEDGAIATVVGAYQRRFRQVVLDTPRGDPSLLRQALEAATDLVLVCDLTLAGTRDAMRLLTLAADVAPQLRMHMIAGGATDPKKAPIKLADLERSVKQKAVCQVAFDDKNVAAAINAGKPLNEAMPRSVAVKSLQPLVNAMLAAVDPDAAAARSDPFWSRLLKPKGRVNAAPAGAGA
ncbi:cellulose synthase operon protein YhjQ/BcsQ [Vineibacter terrae]|uniref:cellulose synthase operon protein YhjQ/BcsQ n=1 Tax=Vineibacter terrae TaxID=2586908 RepID=UPI002E35AB7B|nr:cellulose synthase operon protein YhjQ/BcsQ [Vineibacter terrae]HEX2885560.1 cellulose synthase operon protein YhjQ/BcsQ [Vineibacter terrae]